MSELNDFLKLMAEGKKTDPVAVKAKEIKENIKGDLGGLFSQLSSLKSEDPKVQQTKRIEAQVQESIKADFSSLLSELAAAKKPAAEVKPIVEEVLIETPPLSTPIGEIPATQVIPDVVDIPSIDKYLKSPQFQEPEKVDVDYGRELKHLTEKFRFLEQWVGKINNAGPGSGEVNLRWLDDVKRDTIADGRWLKYDGSLKKFVFDEINPYEVVHNATEVTTATYTVQDNDYYIGVNYDDAVTITLPNSPSSGRMLVFKDESGNASKNPINVVGNVDNDPEGFILQTDNGGIQLIYRSGWRII
jgi:hypothetical protein